MIQYPALMYKCPGQNRKPCGATFNFVGVDCQEQFDSMIEKGWFPTFEKAKESAGDNAYPKTKKFNRFDAKKPKAKKPSKPLVTYKDQVKMKAEAETEIDVISAPSRLELETKAQELGIKFDGRTTNKKLQDKIEQTLGADNVVD